MENMKEDNLTMILEFLLNGEVFGLEVADILEVNRLPVILPVHGEEKSVIGLINLHGKSVPVIALDVLLMLKSEEIKKELFIALKTKEGPVCFPVDKLIGFEKIWEEKTGGPDRMALKFDAGYLKSTYFRSGLMISVLDVNFLTKTRKKNDDRVSLNAVSDHPAEGTDG